jgi:hypothetical protein
MLMALSFRFGILSVFAVCLVCARPAVADSVQLNNGEVLKGKVLSLDDKQVSLESESLARSAFRAARSQRSRSVTPSHRH